VIKIDFPEPTSNTWKRWRNDCDKATSKLLAALTQGQTVEIQESLYRRRSIKEDVYFAKNGPFRGKCAYCECFITDYQHGDVEHFRPKKAVTDVDDQIVMVSDGEAGTMTEHPGYPWLAYDWTNLLPSCQTCNQPGTVRDGGVERPIGKRNRFPVAGQRAWKPEHDLAAEQPLLINPVMEDPAAHLAVDIETGIMTSKSVRGQACIDVFGLNLRDRLPESRQKTMDAVKALLVELMLQNDPERLRICQEKLDRIEQGQEGDYTLAARAFIASRRTRLQALRETT
jgi:hypothetical protein